MDAVVAAHGWITTSTGRRAARVSRRVRASDAEAAALVGFILGGARNAKPPNELMAAQRGTVLRVRHDSPEIRAALTEGSPIRVDEIGADGTPLDTVVTEGDTSEAGVAQEMRTTSAATATTPSTNPTATPTSDGLPLDAPEEGTRWLRVPRPPCAVSADPTNVNRATSRRREAEEAPGPFKHGGLFRVHQDHGEGGVRPRRS